MKGTLETCMALEQQMQEVVERLARVENMQKILAADNRTRRFIVLVIEALKRCYIDIHRHDCSDMRRLEARPEISALHDVNNRIRKLEEGHQYLHESVTRQSKFVVCFFFLF